MKPRRWRTWLWVLLAWVAAFALLAGLLALQGLMAAATWTGVGGGAAALLWVLWGLWRWRTTRWVSRVGLLAAFSAGCLFCGATFSAGGRGGAAIATTGIWAMTVGFVGGVWALRQCFAGPWAWSAVARTLVDEAVRMKLALVFIVLVVLLVPVLPFLLDVDERLHYRVRFFLTWALTGSTLLLSLMTIFLSCATISGDLKGRQVFMTLTKPMSRGSYLFGKWLGVIAINLLLVAITGIGIGAFVRILAQSGTAQDADDQAALMSEVLVARVAADPEFPPNFDFEALYAERLAQLRADFPDDPTYEQVTPATERIIRAAVIARWHTIGPGMTQGYRFTGLKPAAERAEAGGMRHVQLRLKPTATQSPADGKVRLAFRINERTETSLVMTLPNDIYSIVQVPVEYIDADGAMLVEVGNVADPRQPSTGSVGFSRAEGLQVLYEVGDFTPNLVRALLMLWVRLVFLAMLGVAAATFLDFPVAALLCLMVFAGAIASGFFTQSLHDFGARANEDLPVWRQVLGDFQLMGMRWSEGRRLEAVKIPVRMVGEVFILLVPSFARFNPVPLIADGLLVSWGATLRALGWIGIGWTGVAGAVAWVVFRNRELARVTV